jgi:hypothetical protein
MAGHTLRSWRSRLMKMVRRLMVYIGPMTLLSKLIAFGSQPEAMRIMAIDTTDPGTIHLALYERAVHIDLAVYLAVRVIKAAL